MLSFNSSLKSNINDDTTRHGNVILRRILVKPLFISLVIILFLAAYTPTNIIKNNYITPLTINDKYI